MSLSELRDLYDFHHLHDLTKLMGFDRGPNRAP